MMEGMLGELGSLVAIGLFVVMMAAVEFGRRIGRRRYQTDKESLTEGLSVAEGAIFALLGLLIAAATFCVTYASRTIRLGIFGG